MKKVGIITLTGNDNYGNRLQNYALYKKLSELKDIEPYTIKNYSYSNGKKCFSFMY